MVDEQEIGNGVYRSIRNLLQIFIPIWNKSNLPTLQPGNTVYLKLGGDGRNVGRKQNHVMITICLLNERDEVLKPDHQYSICLYIGKEKYKTLAKVGNLFKYQLQDLQENGITINDIHWSIELFFSGNWKFMYNIMGLNASNSKYFCLYCNCKASDRQKKPSLFPVIKEKNYIPDELHLLLRISDVLMECFFNDLFKKREFEREIKNQIEQTMKSIKVHFEFFKSRSSGGKWDWTSLMGSDKKKVLQYFPIVNFITGKRGEDIQKLWRDFYDLYLVLRSPNITNSEIDNFENKHIPEFIQNLKEKKFGIAVFFYFKYRKKNYNQIIFCETTMGGGIRGKPVVHDIMEFENRQIYYLINNTPHEIQMRQIDAGDKEN
ncbi:hypothetical protein RhiirC2_772307 [Rhizophagus irregularis]|uniref:Uncharacterized protein n=1 Tax=Rhizophagus irregularis TaxID=588596 RepID=A0A2N1NRR3_9GLOM|nr:hypothetical protein RhiirC2_772307 [Rhizophagus irregularis]